MIEWGQNIVLQAEEIIFNFARVEIRSVNGEIRFYTGVGDEFGKARVRVGDRTQMTRIMEK